MRVIFVLLFVLSLMCAPLSVVPLFSQTNADYVAQLNGDDEKLYATAARKLADENQIDVLLAALKSEKAARRSAVVPALENRVTPQVVDVFIGLLQQDPDATVRKAVLGLLGLVYKRPKLEAKQPAILAAIKAAANDADPAIGIAAVTAVGLQAKDDVDFLLGVLANARAGAVRGQTAWMLAGLKDPRIYDALVKAVTDTDAAASGQAVSALGRLGDKRAAPLLLGIFQDNARSRPMRIFAANALAGLAAPEVMDALLEMTKGDIADTRGLAITALRGYSDPRAVQQMVALLSDATATIRLAAAANLSIYKYAPAAGALLEQAKKETQPVTLREMLRALAALNEPGARELYATALASTDLETRKVAIQGLLALRDERAIETVTKMLQNGNQADVEAAIIVLGNSGSPLAIEPLLQYFQRKREEHPEITMNYLEDDNIRKLVGSDGNNMTVVNHTFSKAPVTIGILRSDRERMVGGEIVKALYTLYNRSKTAVVVLGLLPNKHQGEDPIVLSSPAAGEISERDGGYVYRSVNTQTTQIPLHAGLLLPGQAMQVEVPYRPVAEYDRYLVRYLAANQPYDGTPASLAPLTVFMPDPAQAVGGDTRSFIPFTDTGWRAVCKPMQAVTPTGPDAAARAVVVTVDPKVKPREDPMSSRLSVDNSRMVIFESVLVKAADLTKKPPGQIALGYSKALGGYAVAAGNECWLLIDPNQTAKGKALPIFPLQMLKDADMGKVLVQIDPNQPITFTPGKKFWDAYLIEKGDGVTTKGLFISIDAALLPTFLDAVRVMNGRLEMKEYGVRLRYYALKI